MRYFEYISDSKVNMLLPQISSSEKKSISAEIGFDVKLLQGKLKTSRNVLDDRVHRLLAVERHILKNENIGSIGDSKLWIAGEGWAMAGNIKEDSQAVFYFLRQNGTYLALGGSARNLIGNESKKSLEFGISHASHLISLLTATEKESRFLALPENKLTDWLNCGVAGHEQPWAPMIYSMCHRRQERSFSVRISFLARRLLKVAYMDATIVLASPLYVAQAESQ